MLIKLVYLWYFAGIIDENFSDLTIWCHMLGIYHLPFVHASILSSVGVTHWTVLFQWFHFEFQQPFSQWMMNQRIQVSSQWRLLRNCNPNFIRPRLCCNVPLLTFMRNLFYIRVRFISSRGSRYPNGERRRLFNSCFVHPDFLI